TTAEKGTVTFLPEPERRPRKYTVISVDDHIVEPPHTFEGRVPAAFADRAPRVVEKDDGTQTWIYDGEEIPNVGFNAVVGRPVSEACAETQTVINLHIGSSGTSPSTSADAPPDVMGVLFFGYAMFAAVDWLYSLVPVRHPDIRICLSEGGIGWVPALLDRLDHMLRYHEMYGTWSGIELTPAEVMQRNFWFCAVEDPSAFA